MHEVDTGYDSLSLSLSLFSRFDTLMGKISSSSVCGFIHVRAHMSACIAHASLSYLCCDGRILVRVYFDHFNFIFQCRRHLIEFRIHHHTWTTPARIKVHQHRNITLTQHTIKARELLTLCRSMYSYTSTHWTHYTLPPGYACIHCPRLHRASQVRYRHHSEKISEREGDEKRTDGMCANVHLSRRHNGSDIHFFYLSRERHRKTPKKIHSVALHIV